MKKPELIPTLSLIAFIVILVALEYNYQSVVSAIVIAEPIAKVFAIIVAAAVGCGFVASVYFFVKSMIKGGGNNAN